MISHNNDTLPFSAMVNQHDPENSVTFESLGRGILSLAGCMEFTFGNVQFDRGVVPIKMLLRPSSQFNTEMRIYFEVDSESRCKSNFLKAEVPYTCFEHMYLWISMSKTQINIGTGVLIGKNILLSEKIPIKCRGRFRKTKYTYASIDGVSVFVANHSDNPIYIVTGKHILHLYMWYT